MVMRMITETTASEDTPRRGEMDGEERWPSKFVEPPLCIE
jgi:hypothetical protein